MSRQWCDVIQIIGGNSPDKILCFTVHRTVRFHSSNDVIPRRHLSTIQVTRNSPTDIPLWKHSELMLLASGSSSSSRVPVRTLLPSTIQASVSEVIDAVMCLYLGQLLVAWKRKKKTTSLIPFSLTNVLASPPTIKGKLLTSLARLPEQRQW